MATVKQRVFAALAEIGVATKVSTIEEKLSGSYWSITKALTELKKSGLVAESNGYWVITDKGKSTIESDPSLNKFITSSAKKKPKPQTDNLINYIDWELANTSAHCRHVINNAADYLELDNTELLLPLVLIYFASRGFKFKRPTQDIIPRETDEKMVDFYDKAVHFIHGADKD